ncbi:MAG: GNAT family N-acetyltransferase [Succinivibrio sp.]|nr:GNAT family N-acetyltransferase [Succinivibrio sp.]
MVTLQALEVGDRESFILDCQEAFFCDHTSVSGADAEEARQDEAASGEEIIPRALLEKALERSEAYRLVSDGEVCGGLVLRVRGERGELEFLFVSPQLHSKGLGFEAWCLVEKLHPEVRVWETLTPYFLKRNIHFYVNRCGFHIVEFFHERHPMPQVVSGEKPWEVDMLRFEKVMSGH